MGLAHSPSIISDGLVFYLDAANRRSYSGSGLTVNGLVGGIGGTLVNGVGFTSLNNGSFVFDGTNDYINLGNNVSNSYSSLTIESTFKVGIINKKQAILSTYNSGLGWGLEILDNSFSNKFNFFGFVSAGIATGIQSNTSAVLNQIYHVTAVYTGSSSLSIFVNGDYSSSIGTTFLNFIKNSNTNVQIGDDPDTGQSVYFQGNISQVKLYNRALSATEILQNYNATRKRFGL